MASSVADVLEQYFASEAGVERDGSHLAALRPKLRREITVLLQIGEAIRQAPRPGLTGAALLANQRRLMARVAELRMANAGLPVLASGPAGLASAGQVGSSPSA